VSEAVKYFNLTVDPWDSVCQCRYHFSLRDDIGISIDMGRAAHSLKFSVDQADLNGQFIGNALTHK
jgi:hypothetical protein